LSGSDLGTGGVTLASFGDNALGIRQDGYKDPARQKPPVPGDYAWDERAAAAPSMTI